MESSGWRPPFRRLGLLTGLRVPLLALLLSPVTLAHSNPDAPVPHVPALKVDAPLMVDGLLDEPFWAQCEVTSNLLDMRTGQPAGDQTLIRVAYTRTDLYITKHMWVKASIQNTAENLHNYSVIYTWKLKYNTYFYLAYNDVDDGEESGRSILTKLTYTF